MATQANGANKDHSANSGQSLGWGLGIHERHNLAGGADSHALACPNMH